jgi:hypothetical protein
MSCTDIYIDIAFIAELSFNDCMLHYSHYFQIFLRHTVTPHFIFDIFALSYFQPLRPRYRLPDFAPPPPFMSCSHADTRRAISISPVAISRYRYIFAGTAGMSQPMLSLFSLSAAF